MVTRKILAIAVSSVSLIATLAQNVQAQSSSIVDAINEGSAKVSFRLRHEDVEQDNALQDAAATTLKTRLSFVTGKFNGFGGTLEFDNVSQVGADHYNSLVMDEYLGTHSVIADPVYTDVNQALVDYTFDESNSLIGGRQRINHDGQRFIGGVAWRQNEQTYDAFSYKKTGSFTIDYSYLSKVQRIFKSSKPSVQTTTFDSDSHIFYATYGKDWGTLKGFVYALDFKNAAALSSMTYGIAYAGKLGPVGVNASYANQSDYGDNTTSYDADYLAADATIGLGPVSLGLGYELLGSDSGVTAFKTPLATLHKFNGWADVFLATPANGLEDVYFKISGKLAGVSWQAIYHDFSADQGGADYGDEIDLIANYSFNNNVSAQLKYASYSSNGFAVDTDKFWLTVNVSF